MYISIVLLLVFGGCTPVFSFGSFLSTSSSTSSLGHLSLSDFSFIFKMILIIINPIVHLITFFKHGIPDPLTAVHDSRLLVLFSFFSLCYFVKILCTKQVFNWLDHITNSDVLSAYSEEKLQFVGAWVYNTGAISTILSIFVAPWRWFLAIRNFNFNSILTMLVVPFVAFKLFSANFHAFIYDVSRFLYLFLYFRILVSQKADSPLWWSWYYRLFCIFMPAFSLITDYDLKFLVVILVYHLLTFQIFSAWSMLGRMIKYLQWAQILLSSGRSIAISGDAHQLGGALSVVSVDNELGSCVLSSLFEAQFLHMIITLMPNSTQIAALTQEKGLLMLGAYVTYMAWLIDKNPQQYWNFKPPFLMNSHQYALLISQRETIERGVVLTSVSRFRRSLQWWSPSTWIWKFAKIFFTRTTPFFIIVSCLHSLFNYFSWELFSFIFLNILTFEPNRMRCMVTTAIWLCVLIVSSPPIHLDNSKWILSLGFVSKIALVVVLFIMHLFINPILTSFGIPYLLSFFQNATPGWLDVAIFESIFISYYALLENLFYTVVIREKFSIPFFLAEFGIGSDGTFSLSMSTMDPSATLDYPHKISFYPLERSPLASLLKRVADKKRRDTLRLPPDDATNLPALEAVGDEKKPQSSSSSAMEVTIVSIVAVLQIVVFFVLF